MVWNNGDGSDLMVGGEGVDTAVANGGGADEAFSLVDAPEGVRFERTNIGPFALDIRETEIVELNAGAGTDVFDASGMTDAGVSVRASGGEGDDELLGGAGDDVLDGEAGDDFLQGGRGADLMRGGDGNDAMRWNNGDGSDRMIGGAGDDIAQIFAAGDGVDVFEITGDAEGVRVARTNRGQFSVEIAETETLDLETQGGDDLIDASGLEAGGIAVDIQAGAGNDVAIGSQGDDILDGQDGDDLLVGGRGDDRMIGGAGDDRMVWNNGDGSDEMQGGAGLDTVEVNGAGGAGDQFVLTGDAEGATFQRVNLGPFTLDITEVERMEINGGGGDDTLDASGLAADGPALTVTGGAGDDDLIGGAGDDRFVWALGDGDDFVTGGEGYDRQEMIAGDGDESFAIVGDLEELEIDGDTIDVGMLLSDVEKVVFRGGEGDDAIDGSGVTDAAVALKLDGGEGNDVLAGGAGDDRLIGGAGDDRMTGGYGADVFVFEGGADVVEDFQDGVDRLKIEVGEDAGLSIVQQGDDTVLDFGNGDTLTLRDTYAEDIGLEDFLF